MVRARQEFIDELERDFRESFDDKDDKIQRQENEMLKWGAFLGGSSAGRRRQGQEADVAEAMKEHEKLGWDGKQRTGRYTPESDENKKDRDERFVVSTSEGKVKLNRVVDRLDEGHGFWVSHDDAKLRFNTIQDQDPLSNPDQAISWLLTDDYSPLYLDQTLAYKLHPSFYKSDEDDSYFRADYQLGDLYPRFAAESITRHDPRLATKVNWRAAFHDLLDSHNKGYLLSSSLQTTSYPMSAPSSAGKWISHLLDTGSLGSRWYKLSTAEPAFGPSRFRYGNSREAWAVMPLTGQCFVRDSNSRLPLAPFGKYESKNDTLQLIRPAPEPTSAVEARDQPQKEGSEITKRYASSLSPHYLDANLQKTNVLQEALGEAVDDGWWSLRPAFTKAAISLIRNPLTEQSTLRAVDRVLRTTENPELEDEVEPILARVFHGLNLESPDVFKVLIHDLDQLLHDVHYQEWKQAKRAVDSAHPAVYGINLEEPEAETLDSSPPLASDAPSADSQSASFSSSSAYSYKTNFDNDLPANSVISTLTTVESRTLPDGSVETKRVLKKKFGDGREESNETTETQSGRRDDQAQKVVVERPKIIAEQVSEPQAKPTENKTRNGGGWFWN